jgi:hypothetical protein
MISSQTLTAVADYVTGQGVSEQTLLGLRQQFNGVHFTYCMDDDVMAPTAVLERQHFNLYLIDSTNHCLNFTTDAALATGIVVAEVEAER